MKWRILIPLGWILLSCVTLKQVLYIAVFTEYKGWYTPTHSA